MLAFQYLLACDLLKGLARKVDLERRWMHREHMDIPGFGLENLLGNLEEVVSVMKEGIVTMKGVVTKKKYKPMAKKVKPVIASLPGQYRIIREIQGDPLENMPFLEKVPPPFKPMGRYMAERRETLVKEHKNFLWDKEIKLMDHFMCQQNKGFAWADSE